jgi:hypothetical protein
MVKMNYSNYENNDDEQGSVLDLSKACTDFDSKTKIED